MIIHVNTGNQVRISISDVLDALHDYAWIHFTEEEALFMNNPYPVRFDAHSLTIRITRNLPFTRDNMRWVRIRWFMSRTF